MNFDFSIPYFFTWTLKFHQFRVHITLESIL